MEQPLSDQEIESFSESDLASTSSNASSIFTADDTLSTRSSISALSSSSGEFPTILRTTPSGNLCIGGESTVNLERERCVGRRSKGVSWGFSSVIGRRKEMEDAVAVVPEFMSMIPCQDFGGCTSRASANFDQISPVHFFAVYDGHGGDQVAKYCAGRLHEVVADEWSSNSANGSEWRKRWEYAFFNGFERADNEILKETGSHQMVGSTAVAVVLSGCQIITSNCGDSRALLCKGTQTIPLTVDHKPDREDELKRIEAGQGKVINWNGPRVFGVLAMSRAIGDWYLRPWIIPVPEITFMTRSEEDECLILASDGLWDVMSNEEVGELARRLLRRQRRLLVSSTETSPAQVVADTLTEIAYGKNSTDNISIIVVDLKSKRKRNRQ